MDPMGLYYGQYVQNLTEREIFDPLWFVPSVKHMMSVNLEKESRKLQRVVKIVK